MLIDYQRILVAVNHSDEAHHALARAVAIAKRNHARLDILRVLDINSLQYKAGGQTAIDGEEVYDIEQEAEQDLIKLREKLLQEEGLTEDQVFVHLRFGNPRTVIVADFPAEYRNDLLVLGQTGMNALRRVTAGSVASYVTHAASCDVLIVKNKQ